VWVNVAAIVLLASERGSGYCARCKQPVQPSPASQSQLQHRAEALISLQDISQMLTTSADLAAYQGIAEQHDDMTMLVIGVR
jgi:hypothetical protein